MKKLFLTTTLVLAAFLHTHAQAHFTSSKAKATDAAAICQAEADKAIDAYNSELYDRALEQAKIDLEPGQEINMDALPSSPDLVEIIGTEYIYGWGENEECACGASVNVTPATDGKSCKAEVDESSYSCECG